MASIIPDFECDLFISYRHNDNLDGWVTNFVLDLQRELRSATKDTVNVYFDKNPIDGLRETHNVDKSLSGKLRCLVFIPVVSQTYCDVKSFAWQQEFCAFAGQAREDQYGLDVTLGNGNVASRILPVKIHNLDADDASAFEKVVGGPMRAIAFVHQEPGVNRPLSAKDDEVRVPGKVLYRDQVNKVANSVKEIINAMKSPARNLVASKRDRIRPSFKRKVPLSRVANLVIGAILTAAVIGIFSYINSPNLDPLKENSIAVLPFQNISNDPAQEYFSDGITEEILNTLVMIKDLKVAGRTSSFSYKGKNEDLKVIGKALGVSFILDGSVRKSGDVVIITAQLINAETGFHIWSDEYEGRADDVFRLQRNTSVEISQALSRELGISSPLRLSTASTIDPEAYDHYLRGRQVFMRRDNALEAARLFRLSISKDSTFAFAYSGLAAALSTGRLSDSSRSEAIRWAEKALSLDSTNFEAHAAMGTSLDYFRRRVEARLHHQKAVELNPGNSTANLWYGLHLYKVGHLSEALAFAEKSAELEPLYWINHVWAASIANAIGNSALAEAHAKKSMAVGGSTESILINIYISSGQWQKIEDEFINGPYDEEEKKYVADVVRLVRQKDLPGLTALSKDHRVWPEHYYAAQAYPKALETAMANGLVEEVFSVNHQQLRRLPGFKDALTGLGFIEYWTKFGGPDVCPTIIQDDLACN